MIVKVVSTFNGRYILQRLEIPVGGRVCRESIRAEVWTRKVATEALDLLEAVYGIPRDRVRFEHV